MTAPDRFTNTEADALRYERRHAEPSEYTDRGEPIPTLAECEQDEKENER